MAMASKPKILQWTHHARAKMRFYKLSEQRVRSVLHSPKRVEEGVAPKTIAMMQPTSLKMQFLSEVVPAGAKRRAGTHEMKINREVVPAKAGTQEINSEAVPGEAKRRPGTPSLSAVSGYEKGGRQETWTQEIWVMVEDRKGERKVISAWRYPGRTKPRSEAVLSLMKKEYGEFSSKK